MASRIITKKGSGAPLASDLVHGELAVDTVNKRLYTENAGGTIIEVGTSPSTIDINAGTIDGTVIGGSTAAAGTFTTVTADGLTVDGNIEASYAGDSTTAVRTSHDGTTGLITSANFGTGYTDLDIEGKDVFIKRGIFSSIDAIKVEGSTGDISFYEDTGTTPKFFWDASAESLGIGTTSPAQKLHVKGGFPPAILEREGGTTAASGLGFTNSTNSGFIVAASDTTFTISASTNVSGGASLTERMRLDSSGNLLVGKSSAGIANAGFEAIAGTYISSTNAGTTARFNRLSSNGDILDFRKDGTVVGKIGSYSGVVSYLVLDPRANGAGLIGLTNEIAPANELGNPSDGAKSLGNAGRRFDDIYATNGTIQTSDRNEKQDIDVLSEAEQRVAVAAKGLLRKFRWKSKVEEKGDDARIHFGIIAQDLQAAFEAEGLDAGRYAMFINSTWTDEETGEERSRMGVRYSDLLAFIIAAI